MSIDSTERITGADLRSFFHLVGGFSGVRGDMSDSPERPAPEEPVEMLDEFPLDVRDVPPLKDPVFVDGIQSGIHASYVSHRPIMLHHVAAGALDADAKPLLELARIWVTCAPEEAEWLRTAGCPLPIEEVENASPPQITKFAYDRLGGARESLERDVVEQLTTLHPATIVVDGGLGGRPREERVVGVVKSTEKRYLPDESVLWRLPHGWRSPRFKIEKGGALRYTAYLRLTPADNRPWDFGLIRVETWDPDLIDAAGALCLQFRQGPGGDHRWDRHIQGVANVERYLKARRPDVFLLAE